MRIVFHARLYYNKSVSMLTKKEGSISLPVGLEIIRWWVPTEGQSSFLFHTCSQDISLFSACFHFRCYSLLCSMASVAIGGIMLLADSCPILSFRPVCPVRPDCIYLITVQSDSESSEWLWVTRLWVIRVTVSHVTTVDWVTRVNVSHLRECESS